MLARVAELGALVAVIEAGEITPAMRASAAAIAQFSVPTRAATMKTKSGTYFLPCWPAEMPAGVQTVLRLQQDHGWLDEDWLELESHVQAIATGYGSCDIDTLREGASILAALYEEHIALEFKRVLAEATDEDMVEFTSVAGLPARAVATPWLRAYLKIEHKLQSVARVKSRCTKAFDCLAQCGLRDGLAGWGQFCIDSQLAAALRGDVKKGLFFRGKGALPFGDQIRSVRELMERLLTPNPALAL